MSAIPPKTVRCAIYTRKSSEEGLEQDFNSLDAQREACAAYVLSQASQGWSLIDEMYDDGGLSGGSLERPALQRLLADIEQGLIDIIVVYKVDRLTRSLLDFAKLVETMDKTDVSFVSVTQSFNTTNSMGRLTLNMLLSFAQFEREVTAERIRDKIAASKAKGMWMGGVPPLGYEPDGRSLKIVEEHADLVRQIYDAYLELGNVRLLHERLERSSIASPVRYTATGKAFGGGTLSRGQLYTILRNPVYAGLIGHKGEHHEGLHEPIVERPIWDRVQAKLANNRQGSGKRRAPRKCLLAGLVVDEAGNLFQTSHTKKGAREYRYYVSQSDGTNADKTMQARTRIPAADLERAIREELAKHLSDPLSLLDPSQVSADQLSSLYDRVAELGTRLRSRSSKLIRDLVAKVIVGSNVIEVEVNLSAIARQLELDDVHTIVAASTFTIAAQIKRTGHVLRLIEDNGSEVHCTKPNLALISLLAKAHNWWVELAKGETDIAKLSRKEGVTASWMTRVVRLAFLSPQVTEAILDGRTRADLEAKTLLATGGIPSCWKEQHRRFLPGQPPPLAQSGAGLAVDMREREHA